MATSLAPATRPETATPADVLPFVARLLMSVLFIISGFGKAMAPEATIGFIASVGLPFASLGLVVALFVELVCSTALILGYHTRLAAAIMALFCLATAAFFHAHFGDQNQVIHFFKNITMAGGFLHIVAFGAGRFSLDARHG